MRKPSKNELDDLYFDAELMNFRVVYIEKPLDENRFVLYHNKPQLEHVGHYRRLNDVKLVMQKYSRPILG
jgi:hypothetical protein